MNNPREDHFKNSICEGLNSGSVVALKKIKKKSFNPHKKYTEEFLIFPL